MTLFTPTEQAAISRCSLYNGDRYNQSSNPYGFGGPGYKTLFPQSLRDFATGVNAVERLAGIADTAATAAAAVVAGRPKATSTDNRAIGSSGSRTFATAENLLTARPFFVGDNVKAYSTASPENYVAGVVTAVSANSLTFTIHSSGGSGTFASWTIIGAGEKGAATGISSVQADTAPTLGGDLLTGGNVISVGTGDGISFSATSDGLAMNGAPINDARVNAYDEQVQNLGTLSNTVTLAPTGGIHKYGTLGGNITVALPASVAAGGKTALVFEVTQPAGQSYTITWPASGITWVGSAPPAPAAGKRLQVVFTRRAGDAVWIAQTQWTGVAA